MLHKAYLKRARQVSILEIFGIELPRWSSWCLSRGTHGMMTVAHVSHTGPCSRVFPVRL